METILACFYMVLIALSLQVLVLHICAGHPAMWQRRNYFRWSAVAWSLMPIGKHWYVDEVLTPSDGVFHELIAREVSDLLHSGRFAEAASYFAIGNDAYRFILGVFYALTRAPEIVAYSVNAALGCLGLVVLLDILCLHSRCRRLPVPVILVTILLPSAMLWSTANLKEGATLWGICMMLYFTVPAPRLGISRQRLALPIVGSIAVAIMRPHIAAIWLIAIAAGRTLQTNRIGAFLVMAGAGSVLFAMLNAYVPDLMAHMAGEGISNALADRYSTLSTNENLNGVALTGNRPLPVVSGLAVILFRPWPFEVNNVLELLVGLEVWMLALFGVISWGRANQRWKLIAHPAVVTQIVALLAMGFFFSYMYNMGLAVRQRLMCFPAVLFIYVYPLLAGHPLKREVTRRYALEAKFRVGRLPRARNHCA